MVHLVHKMRTFYHFFEKSNLYSYQGSYLKWLFSSLNSKKNANFSFRIVWVGKGECFVLKSLNIKLFKMAIKQNKHNAKVH
ncbi:hypothetical protein CMT48_13910 [Elizabethkingia anophelis]|nr:hypothetical protein [Elizabethkingia anophelis]